MLEALKLDQVTISDKFLMMEELWESMRKESTAKYFTPQWHLDILYSREKKVGDRFRILSCGILRTFKESNNA